MSNDHDALFRQTFREPVHAAALLRSILPPPVANAIDWGTLAPVSATFVDPELRGHHADLLFTVEAARQPVLLYVLFEHKSEDERFTAFQLLRYVVRLWERHRAQHPMSRDLPPVLPVVVHHGLRGWSAPRTVLELVALAGLPPALQKALAALQPNLHFVLDDLTAHGEQRLRERPLPPPALLALLLLQAVVRSAEQDPVAFVERWLPVWRACRDVPGGAFALGALLSYLSRRLEAPKERILRAEARIHGDDEPMGKTIYQQCIEEGLEKGLQEGRAEGRVEGRAEGSAALLLRLLQRRFGDVPPAIAERLRTSDVATLDRLADRLFEITSIDGLFA